MSRGPVPEMPLLKLVYPAQFPPERQAAVEFESMRAARDLGLPADTAAVSLAELRQGALRWVCRVLGVFAGQACEMAKAKLWTVKQVGDAVADFRLQLVQAAHFRLADARLGWVDHVFGTYVSPEIYRQIENSEEVQRFQNEFLELAEQATRNTDLSPETDEAREVDPEAWLKDFLAAHPEATYADIKYSAKVHTADFQKWRKGQLKRSSVMADRIEKVLSGQLPLKKKPTQKAAVYPTAASSLPDRGRGGR